MFSNISHLLQILHSVSTRDTGFLYHSQSKHILGTDRANHNIFTEQPVPNRWQSQHRLIQSINHRLRHWHHLQPSDSVRFWEFRAHWRTTLCVCSPHSCRALWWCRQRAPALTAKNMPGEKITREGGGANVENEGRWETENAQMVYNIKKYAYEVGVKKSARWREERWRRQERLDQWSSGWINRPSRRMQLKVPVVARQHWQFFF